ncbi:hypothetical protein L6164_000326 [Bauhinia variegata]|uniref:Uncharacterized protein n=1 Tax=Bauhinia variegata TaxID=167791 RepID=A0ACB9Q5D8_BAUVA|nr:hypothetical protein L6164_000326 [Bauhinia variegata]
MAMISNISPLLVIISFLLLTNNVNPQSSKYPGNYTNPIHLEVEGDASSTNGISLQLTAVGNGIPFPNSAGRVSYADPVQLWDSKTGKLASFTTIFTFVVKPNGLAPFGDGISFFIAQFNSKSQQIQVPFCSKSPRESHCCC